LTIKSTSHTTGNQPLPVPQKKAGQAGPACRNPYIPVKQNRFFGLMNATFAL